MLSLTIIARFLALHLIMIQISNIFHYFINCECMCRHVVISAIISLEMQGCREKEIGMVASTNCMNCFIRFIQQERH